MRHIILLLCFFYLINGDVFGQQLEEFTPDSITFIKELNSTFKNIRIKEQKEICEAFYEKFVIDWNSEMYSSDQRDSMYVMINRMVKRRFKPYPDLYNYLYSYNSFITSDQSKQSFLSWNASINELLKDKRTSHPIKNFLEFSQKLFSQNILYQTRATTWKASNNRFSFRFDSLPTVVFDSINLVCYANKDSTYIFSTIGNYYPTIETWRGTGGRVTWIRAGYEPGEVYALLHQYEIITKFSRYEAEGVRFYHKKYFKKPLLGNLSEKVKANITPENASYPRFQSNFKHLEIDSLFRDINYYGGFSMHGGKILGEGSDEKESMLVFRKDNEDFIVAKSKVFVIRPDRISSSNAEVTIYFKEDSIHHQGLEFKYRNENRELSLIRSGSGMAKSPFFNSFHKVDMYCEAMYWDMDEDDISFEMIKGISGYGHATFESANYFSMQRYLKLQGIDEHNPLNLIKRYSEEFFTDEVHVSGFSEFIRMPKEQIIAMFVRLSNLGFVRYNPDTQIATINSRLYEYINAMNHKIDYDVIQFDSETYGQTNGKLNLDSFDLRINGISRIFLSDSQKVFIYPKNKMIILKENRNFLFTGRVHAGLFDFYANACSFNYNQFKLDMPTIDSMSFMVQSFEKDADVYGRKTLVRVKTVIADLSGDLLIDDPNNKSGLKSYPQYPIFTSTKDAYVYYDKKTIHQGVYNRDKFYFYVYPFTIDSLDNFSTEFLQFDGYLASGGIFPDMEESLKVQPDYSLGFVSNTPREGYPVYGGKGTYYSEINLSNQGLRGDGSLEYLTSTSWSKDFLFFPDSTNAIANNFVIRETTGAVEYPTVKGIDVKEHWKPYEDKMIISMIEYPLSMYKNQSELFGRLGLTPSQLTGAGMMKFEEAEMDAQMFRFKQHEFNADTSDFRLRTLDQSHIAFSTHNYRGHIDFEEREGTFNSNGGISLVEFPVNEYIGFMDRFNWFMDKDEITLGSATAEEIAAYDNLTIRELVDIDFTGSEFISVHPDQDSLRFYSTTATFSLKDNKIVAEDVKYIRVADAAIFPDDKTVTIHKNAFMKTIPKAQILANTVTKYHEIYDATVNIKSRKDYTAQGIYDYIDETGYKQQIKLNSITVDTTYQSYALGNISDSLGFTLSNDFDFTGKVKLKASEEFLTYQGGFRIRHICNPGKRSWIDFISPIDPKNIMIPVIDSLRDIANKPIESAILFSHEYNRFYSGFLNKKRKKNDEIVLAAKGFIRFDKIAEDYEIGSRERLERNTIYGNHLALDRRNCILRGEGKLDLGAELGMVKLQPYGKVEQYLLPDSTKFDLVLAIDFPFEDKALEIMTEDLIGKNLAGIDLQRRTFTKAITDILGEKDAEKMISDINLYNKMKRFPSEFIHSFFLTDIKLKWNYTTRSYTSVGQIGIGAILKKQINKYVTGYLEIERKRTGDVISLYIEFDRGNNWYFFNYRNNLMQAISSNQEFNALIRDLKDDKRVIKGEKGQEDYTFIISNLMKKTDFLRRFKRN
jgi:hypothetical protein